MLCRSLAARKEFVCSFAEVGFWRAFEQTNCLLNVKIATSVNNASGYHLPNLGERTERTATPASGLLACDRLSGRVTGVDESRQSQ